MIYPETFEHKIGFDAVRRRLSELCISAGSRELVSDMSFLADYQQIRLLLDEVVEMVAVNGSGERPDIIELGDMSHALGRLRVAGTSLSIDEIIDIRRLLQATAAISDYFRTKRDENGVTPYVRLDAIASELFLMPGVLREIDKVIDLHGNVKDSASPELASIRRELSSVSGRINSIMRRVISKAVGEGYLSADVNPTVRDGRLVLPVQPMHKRHISGIVHDESASGKTYFIEPAEIVEANNRVRELQIEERREIARILKMLADMIRPSADDLLRDARILFRFDFINAKALFAAETGGQCPTMTDKPELEWYHAIHPACRCH